jgi:xanthine dehydrogenase YagS FAD-binding subunit
MKLFNHINARSVDEATELLANYEGKAKLNAGGTDLLGVLKDRILPDYPEVIVNIKMIPGLNTIEEGEKGINIGALTTLADIITSPLIEKNCSLLPPDPEHGNDWRQPLSGYPLLVLSISR